MTERLDDWIAESTHVHAERLRRPAARTEGGNMIGTFLAGPVGSWLRVFAAAALGLYLIDLQSDDLTLGVADYLTAGATAVVPIIIAWLNTADPRFGSGSG